MALAKGLTIRWKKSHGGDHFDVLVQLINVLDGTQTGQSKRRPRQKGTAQGSQFHGLFRARRVCEPKRGAVEFPGTSRVKSG